MTNGGLELTDGGRTGSSEFGHFMVWLRIRVLRVGHWAREDSPDRTGIRRTARSKPDDSEQEVGVGLPQTYLLLSFQSSVGDSENLSFGVL